MKTKVIAVDFTGGAEIYDTIKEGLAGLEVGTLGEQGVCSVLSRMTGLRIMYQCNQTISVCLVQM